MPTLWKRSAAYSNASLASTQVVGQMAAAGATASNSAAAAVRTANRSRRKAVSGEAMPPKDGLRRPRPHRAEPAPETERHRGPRNSGGRCERDTYYGTRAETGLSLLDGEDDRRDQFPSGALGRPAPPP